MSVEPDNLRDGHKGNPPWKKLWDRCYQMYLRLYVFTNKEPVLTIRRALWCEHMRMAHACMHATMHDCQVSDEGTLMRFFAASSSSARIHLFWLPTCTAGSSPQAGRLRLATFWLPSAWSQVGASQVACAQHAMLDMTLELHDNVVRLPAMQAWCSFLSHLRPPALHCAPLHMC
jgi:hypothetical protein